VTLTYVRDQFASYGRTLFVVAPYVALAFAAAVIGRSTLAGVGSAIGFAFIEPLISGLMRLGGSFWQDIPRFLMNSNIEVIVLQNKLPDVLPSFGPSRQDLANQHVNSPQVAAIVLAVYIVAFIALAFYVYRRRDITAT
jgi:ABC-type transport system involved in multi-copper enzyme maturation permease subunit